jgi:FkbM family methyltransferase
MKAKRSPWSPAVDAFAAAALWSERPGLSRRAVRWPLQRLRKLAVSASDPIVCYRHAGFDLLLPLSHQLPYYRLWFPEYDLALGRLAKAVAERYPQGSVVDIGANVGDSAAVVRAVCALPILCIEGEPRFFALLERNALRLGPAIHLARALVGDGSASAPASLTSRAGTARLVEGQVETRLESLESILAREPALPPPALVKIDTDGFDCRIIESNGPLWERCKPTLFFEYDPAFYPASWDPQRMWDALVSIGYERLLAYENVGDFLVSLRLEDAATLRDLHEHFSGRRSLRYLDVCLFHARDRSLAASFHEGELAHFRGLRTGSK